MIKIKIYKNAIFINGHANYDEIGKDIVCAGVSAIAMGALNWFDQQKIKVTIYDGFLSLIIKDKNQQYYDYIDLINIQLQAIRSSYSNFISIKTFNTDYQGD